MSEEAKRRYVGMQIVADITDRDRDEIIAAIEKILCPTCPDGEDGCKVESFALTSHEDFNTVMRWVNGED